MSIHENDRRDPRLESEGQRLLLALPESLGGIARRIGVSKPMVSRWRSGEKTPGPGNRAMLRDVFGIPKDAWDERPKKAGEPEDAELELEDDEDLDEEDDDVSESTPPPASPDTLDEVDQLIRDVRVERRADLTAAQKARLAESEMKLLAMKARLERERDLFDARLVAEHPAWLRIKRAIVAAFSDDPEGLRKLERALAESGG